MVVGICRVTINIGGSFSLKDKRSVVKSIINRIRSRYNVAIAEVSLNDNWRRAVLGIACVSNESAHADKMLEEVIAYIESDGRVVLENYTTEKIYINTNTE